MIRFAMAFAMLLPLAACGGGDGEGDGVGGVTAAQADALNRAAARVDAQGEVANDAVPASSPSSKP
ncbi:hypothetical protein [Sphingobium amiense]|uniref:hypothetical protein n=1 Tax=Sphingobium amiense TaxID=135719 RepID=UPI00082C1AD5|nr:hypothetical protein [Sphingobium amiense]